MHGLSLVARVIRATAAVIMNELIQATPSMAFQYRS